MSKLTIAILLLGAGLRTAAFAAERSLWIDEAMVALNVVERSPARLFEPLDRNQGAPVGFLLATKASVGVFGVTERALRLPAFLASLVGLVAFAVAAQRLLPRFAAHLASALFAVSPHLVSYAAECKQYSGDAAFAAVLLALGAGPLTRRRWLAFGIVGSIAVWCSHPALFVLAGLGISLFGQAVRSRDRTRIFASLALGAAWLGSFAAVYLVNLRHLGHNDYLIQYWAGHFAPLPTSRSGVIWYVDHALAFANEPGGMVGENRIAQAIGFVIVVLGVVGLIAMRKLNGKQTSPPAIASAFLLTVTITLVASALHLYPFVGRLLLFLVPMACLLWGAGAVWLCEQLGRRGVVLGGLLCVWPLIQSVHQIDGPKRAEEIRPMLDRIRADWQPGDRIYVYGGSGDAGAGPAFDFYSPRYDFPAGSVIRGGIHRDQPSMYREEILKLPAGRIWVLFTHRHRDEESVIRTALEERGPGQPAMRVPGGALDLYQSPR